MISKFFYNIRITEIILIIMTGIFFGTPLQNYALIAKLLLIIVLLMSFILNKFNVNNISNFYLLILFSFPFIYAFRSNLIFDQSFLKGIIANFNHWGFLIIIYIYYFFKRNQNGVSLLESSIIRLGWLSVFIIYPIKILYPDLEYVVNSFDGSSEYTFSVKNSLSSVFIVWSGFIYMIKYQYSKNFFFLLYSIILVSYPVIFNNARSYVFALFIYFLYFKFIGLNTRTFLNFFKLFCIVFILFIIILSNSSFYLFFVDKINLFKEAVLVISGQSSDDLSVSFRLLQSIDAFKFIEDFYILGVGTLDTFTSKKFVSDYFHPSDIGLIGVIFNYGILGMLILLYQIKIFSFHFKANKHLNNSFIIGTSHFLIIQYIVSIFTGAFAFNISITFLLLGVIIFGAQSLKQENYDSNSAS